MGRIKSTMIKRAARQLYAEVDGFNENFGNNKALLKETMPYKSMRNKVAGGIVKLARKDKAKAKT
jgi:ribosomal protein S17E